MWEAWFTLACLGNFQKSENYMWPSWYWLFGDMIFSTDFRTPGPWNHLILTLFEVKEMEWKPTPGYRLSLFLSV